MSPAGESSPCPSPVLHPAESTSSRVDSASPIRSGTAKPGLHSLEGPSVPVQSRGVGGLLDRLLRDREGFVDEIFEGREVGRRLRSFLLVTVALTGAYGLAMGLMGFREDLTAGALQMLASAVKVPVLFILSTAICFPVLYIVQVLMGARLAFSQTLALILMALALNGVLLASCAPIAFFFAATGSSHDFMKLLHVLIFGFSGVWSMLSLWQGLRAMCERSNLYPPLAVRILQVWMLVFAFVGTQMAWSLRPFVGSPGQAFTFFREQDGNFYVGVWSSLKRVAQGRDNGGEGDRPAVGERSR